MTFTEKAKKEILNTKITQPCCQTSALSAFIRCSGTLALYGGHIGFEAVTESKMAVSFFSKIITSLYGAEPVFEEYKDKFTRKPKYKISLVNENSTFILTQLGIISESPSGTTVNLSIDKYLIENECCKKAYVLGAFLASGSVTVPKEGVNSSTSYHLEVVFSKYQTATCFCELLSEVGFMPKLTERKENFIVYFKNGDEISDFLFFVGARKSGFEVQDIVVKKVMNNDTNRKRNCDMANISKQIEASLKQVRDITVIDQTIGLDSLPLALKQTALLRLENRDSTLEEMSKISGLSKSCLNHRLRKIGEIAKNL